MSSIVLRSRMLSNKCSSKIISRRVLSSVIDSSSSSPSRETIIASQPILSDQSQAPPLPPAPETAPQASGGKAWSFLKYGLIAAVTGTAGYAGYVSYKCSYEEVDQKAKALRAAASFSPTEDASAVDKYRGLLYSAAMAVPAKALEAYLDLRRLVEENVLEFTEPTSDKLLPDLHPQEQHVFTLVLDLNETLLYTDWKHVDPACERLDPNHFIRYRLSRGDSKYQDGKHYRDLSKLNRDPAKILYVSAHAFESSLQPENCVPIKPFKLEGEDTALLDLIPFLECESKNKGSSKVVSGGDEDRVVHC
ncbi:hypothetical protein V6N13_068894 [Hibiscus sabdariffa]|uniref:Mitochondrial import inner membrane translocase subunit TIM50 n=1 Tax=Hibiscus sabdariffa TaxID=183260 RepID=A0ABR2QP01_9ROSI